MQNIITKLGTVLLVFNLISCASGNLTVIQRSGGNILKSEYSDSMGETEVTVTMPDKEILKGTLIWIPPNSNLGTVLVANNAGGQAFGTGISSGNKGMYIGTIVGNNGTTMRIELLCNTWTGKCVGSGQSNMGEIYDIQR